MPRHRSLATDLRSIVDRFAAELASVIERRAHGEARAVVLRALGANGSAAPARRGPGRPPGSKTKRPAPTRRRRKPVTAAERRGRVLQGRYMGGLRGLTKGDQAKVKAARAKGNLEAAIKLAGSLKAKAAV